jgi:glycosyltransferase involved in cell wall biosynthesis
LKPWLKTVLNGVNTEAFAPGMADGDPIKAAFRIPPGAPVIGTIAVFRTQKRLDTWLAIAHQILKSFPETHFIIVGDGPLKDMLLDKRKELGLEQQVHFAGLQTEVRPYLAAFDIFMMSSEFEGLPLALLEAMSSGRPVISTDAGGIKEVIIHERDGLLVGVEEPEKLVECAAQLLADPNKRKAFGLQGRNRIIESFSMIKMVKELEDVYRSFQKPDAGKAIARKIK